MIVNAEQIKAARALLRWSARELAERARVHLSTVQRMERKAGALQGSVVTRRKVQEVLESHGIEFLGDDGVRRHAGAEH